MCFTRSNYQISKEHEDTAQWKHSRAWSIWSATWNGNLGDTVPRQTIKDSDKNQGRTENRESWTIPQIWQILCYSKDMWAGYAQNRQTPYLCIKPSNGKATENRKKDPLFSNGSKHLLELRILYWSTLPAASKRIQREKKSWKISQSHDGGYDPGNKKIHQK